MIKKEPRRKISVDDIKRMKKLRKQGFSYSNISLKLLIPYGDVLYHLNDERREKIKEANRLNSKYTPEKKEYMKKYNKERYKLDPEFRKKCIARSRLYYQKKKELK